MASMRRRGLSGCGGRLISDVMSTTVVVNGESRVVPPGQTVGGLLTALGLDRRKVAVERNAAIVPRSAYDNAVLAAADQIEIVHFIGGG